MDGANNTNAAATAAAKIGENQIRTAQDTLRKYKQGKARLEKRIIENEQYWKLRHWQQMKKEGQGGNGSDPEPASGWLVNVVLNRHADAMDSYPEPNFLPRAADDREEADRLKKIVPVILKRTGFKRVWSGNWWNKLKSGTSAYGVFWDGTKDGGLGDISIRKVDLLNLYWEPGVTDIQESRNVFYTELEDNATLVEQYPQLEGKLTNTGDGMQSKYIHDDTVDAGDKSLVINWYYKKWLSPAKQVLHYCKFVLGCTEVLFATENETARPTRQTLVGVDEAGLPIMEDMPAGRSMAERGWYDHGKYPFVLDVLYPEEGTPVGYGFVDICKSPQKQIDILNQAIIKNAVWAATPRYFVRETGSINEQEFADVTKPFVHTDQNLGQDSIMPIQRPELPGMVMTVLQSKINEMRETSGNTESATGISSAGVTAASAIAALQEASGKLSRDMIGDGGYNAYEDMVLMVIDLIRQFYDQPRMFRITGEMGREEFTAYSNAGLQPKPTGGGYREPVFDIEVVPQTESRYNKTEYNSLALQLYGAGFFQPNNATQALMCLQMMDFKGRDELMQQIQRSGDLSRQISYWQQTALMQAQMLDRLQGGGNTAETVAGQIMGNQQAAGTAVGTVGKEAVPDGELKKENAVTEKARMQTQAASKPQ